MTDAFDDIAERIGWAGLHSQVLASFQQLQKQHPDGVTTETLGVHAWEQIDREERVRCFPHVLGCYASRILDECNEQRLNLDASDPSKTYLEPGDAADLWDVLTYSQALGRDVEVEVSARSLANVLSELDLLRHRLAMREQDGGH